MIFTRRVPRCFAPALAQTLFVAWVCLSSAAPAAAAPAKAPEAPVELRTPIGGVAAISAEDPEGVELPIGSDESIAILMPKDSPFVQGVELEIKSPRAAIAVPGGFAYELWRRIDPEPDRKRSAYRGVRIITQSLPARAGYAIRIPVRADHALRASPYSDLIPFIVGPEDFPFLLRLVPLSKALSSEAEAAKFRIRARPLLTEEGALSLRLRYPEGAGERQAAAVTVTVDDRKVDPSAPILLKAGSHALVVASDDYRDESRVVVVEQGKTLELVVELQDARPTLVVEAPDSALVSVDGRRIDQSERGGLRIEAGDHMATCKIGDYTLTRKFTASRGKPYKLVLDIDLRVEEDQ